MREILFRGKRLDNGKWVEGAFCPKNCDSIFGPMVYKPSIIKLDKPNDGYWFDVEPDTVGQYTGLQDKNGKKIFEGDIFKFPDEIFESYYTSCGTEYNSWETENYAVVGFNEYTGGFDFVRYQCQESSVQADLHENHELDFYEFVRGLEVIGNIHDNPELVEAPFEDR